MRGGGMKLAEFIRMLERNGWWIERDRGPYTIYTNGEASKPIPRHKELKETLRSNFTQWNINKTGFACF
jgi:predicted RNA binding protein YcfA (HicA-like mRNA interferase family)